MTLHTLTPPITSVKPPLTAGNDADVAPNLDRKYDAKYFARFYVWFRVEAAITRRPSHRSVREDFHSYGSSVSFRTRISVSDTRTSRVTTLPGVFLCYPCTHSLTLQCHCLLGSKSHSVSRQCTEDPTSPFLQWVAWVTLPHLPVSQYPFSTFVWASIAIQIQFRFAVSVSYPADYTVL